MFPPVATTTPAVVKLECTYYRCSQPATHVLVHQRDTTPQQPVCLQHLAVSRQGADIVYLIDAKGNLKQIG